MPRGLLIVALCLPLAVLMGFMLADPLMAQNLMVVGAAMFVLLIPIFISIHHTALIWSAGAFINVFFLKGRPQLWMIVALLSFGISVLSRPLSRNKAKPMWENATLYSLLFLGLIAAFTMHQTGGLGLQVLGSDKFGGRRYVYIFCAILGFIALTLTKVPRKNVQRDVGIFCLSPGTAAVGNIAYMLGPAFYILFLLFPVEVVFMQSAADFDPSTTMKRYAGFGPTAIGLIMFCLARWGLKGVIDLARPYRIGLIIFAIILALFSGFRSALAVSAIVLVIQFFAEGLYRTRLAFVTAGMATFFFIFLSLFAEELPMAAQRAVSFLPVKVSSAASLDAQATVEWRIEMWRVVVREIPKYFWIGKGYNVDPTDLYLFNESFKRGYVSNYDLFVQAGDYHNGPLSVIVTFGIFGAIGFLWFTWASFRVMWRNMLYGDADIAKTNIFLFSFFTGRMIYFYFFFGAVDSDLWLFASIVGLSLSINGGMMRKPEGAPLQIIQRTAEERALISV